MIGGIITSAISWRATFASEVLLALVILVMSRKIVDVPFIGTKPKLDFVGVILSAAAMAFMVFGVMQASDYGWLQARQDWVVAGRVLIPQGGISPVIPLVVVGLIGFWLFFRHIRSREEAGKEPLVHLRVLGSGLTNIGLITQNVQWFVLLGSSFVLAVYFQVARGQQRHRDRAAHDARNHRRVDLLGADPEHREAAPGAPGSRRRVRRRGLGIVLMLVAAMFAGSDWATGAWSVHLRPWHGGDPARLGDPGAVEHAGGRPERDLGCLPQRL